MRFDDKLDLETFVPQLEKQESASSKGMQGNQGASNGSGEVSAKNGEGNNMPPASGNPSLAGASGAPGLMQDQQGMEAAGMEMPDFPAGHEDEGSPRLSSKALRHLPQEILDMLGSAALPTGSASDGELPGSVLSEDGDGQAVSDDQIQALIEAIAPLAQGKEGMRQEQELVDENPRSRLLKERMKAINERNLKRAAQKKRK